MTQELPQLPSQEGVKPKTLQALLCIKPVNYFRYFVTMIGDREEVAQTAFTNTNTSAINLEDLEGINYKGLVELYFVLLVIEAKANEAISELTDDNLEETMRVLKTMENINTEVRKQIITKLPKNQNISHIELVNRVRKKLSLLELKMKPLQLHEIEEFRYGVHSIIAQLPVVEGRKLCNFLRERYKAEKLEMQQQYGEEVTKQSFFMSDNVKTSFFHTPLTAK